MATKLILLSLLILKLLMFTNAKIVGVCFGQIGDGLPSEQDVINLYVKHGITRMRNYAPNPAILQALTGTNIELILDVPNESIESLTNPNIAATWVQNNILKYPGVKFRYISVGNEVDPNNESRRFASFVLPAMKNVQKAIRDAGLHIKVSTATYTGLLKTSYPPSEGAFHDNVVGFIQPIIKFLVENNSPILANIYPYFSYVGPPKLDLSYALFTSSGPSFNDKGRDYYNLFDAIFDAYLAAKARLGGANVRIVVSESGWPSAGNDGATLENAGTYYRNLIAHVKSGKGTPVKPGVTIETYLFAMFNENRKPGQESERHFGVFKHNQQPKYQLSF